VVRGTCGDIPRVWVNARGLYHSKIDQQIIIISTR
jgi:hypothetical protein